MHLIKGEIKAKFLAERLEFFQNDTLNGAHSIFLGQVRADQTESGFVKGIEYEAYAEMAEKEIRQFIDLTIPQYSLNAIEVYHSVGFVKTGAYSVLIIVNSVHRKNCLEALAYLVERIKYDIPIWKREVYSDGTKHWVNEYQKRKSNA